MHSLSCLLLLTMFQQLQCRHASYQSVSEQNLQSLGWDHRQVIYWRPWCLCVWCADGSHGAYMLALSLAVPMRMSSLFFQLNSKKTIFTRWEKLERNAFNINILFSECRNFPLLNICLSKIWFGKKSYTRILSMEPNQIPMLNTHYAHPMRWAETSIEHTARYSIFRSIASIHTC